MKRECVHDVNCIALKLQVNTSWCLSDVIWILSPWTAHKPNFNIQLYLNFAKRQSHLVFSNWRLRYHKGTQILNSMSGHFRWHTPNYLAQLFVPNLAIIRWSGVNVKETALLSVYDLIKLILKFTTIRGYLLWNGFIVGNDWCWRAKRR